LFQEVVTHHVSFESDLLIIFRHVSLLVLFFFTIRTDYSYLHKETNTQLGQGLPQEILKYPRVEIIICKLTYCVLANKKISYEL